MQIASYPYSHKEDAFYARGVTSHTLPISIEHIKKAFPKSRPGGDSESSLSFLLLLHTKLPDVFFYETNRNSCIHFVWAIHNVVSGKRSKAPR
jgi:hypothetical protein